MCQCVLVPTFNKMRHSVHNYVVGGGLSNPLTASHPVNQWARVLIEMSPSETSGISLCVSDGYINI